MTKFTSVVTGISICCFLAACNLHYSEEIARAHLEAMRQEIIEFIGEPSCRDSTDCRLIAVGAKPCGGPWEFLIYSPSDIDTLELRSMVDSYNRLNDEMNHLYGWDSDCALAPMPDVGCRDGVCIDLGR